MLSPDPFADASGPLSAGIRSGAPEYEHGAAGTGIPVQEEIAVPRRFAAASGVIGVTVALLALQCVSLQVRDAAANRARAEGNSLRIRTVPADRGLIVDAAGSPVAQNDRKLALTVEPQSLPAKKADREAVYGLLRRKAGLTDDEIDVLEKTRETARDPVTVRAAIDGDQGLLLSEWFADVPGVAVREEPVRRYVPFPSASQLLGYVGGISQSDLDNGAARGARIGKAGLEATYDSALAGTPGQQKVETDARGTVVRMLPGGTKAVAGRTLQLSIDMKLQRAVGDALNAELARRTAKFGPLPDLGASAVVLDPRTGAVKAMVSLPDADPQEFARGIRAERYAALLAEPGNPLLNRTVQGQYPPGSTIKPMVAAAGLQAGTITADTSFVTPDAISIGGFRFPDWKVHGLTNTRKAIAESNNIFFYAVGGGWPEKGVTGLGVDRLNAALAGQGLGAKTGVDLPAEKEGLLAGGDWKQARFNERWYIGDTYHSSIGQGYSLATPLQMAASTAAIASGSYHVPYLGERTLDPGGGAAADVPHPAARSTGISAENLQVVREGMRQAILTGSARPLNKLGITSAGKTGTAQFGTKGLTHAWYVGFAPFDDPRYAFAVMVEGGGESFYSSVPVAEDILRAVSNEPLQPGQQPFSATDVPVDFTGER